MTLRSIGVLVLAASLPLSIATGCATTATISRPAGHQVVGHISGGDQSHLYVSTVGGQVAIPRSEIVDIDHPGDTVAVIGSILTGYGVLNIAVGVPKCESEGAAFCTGVFTPAAVGLPMLLWGIVVHINSTSAMDSAPRGQATLQLQPGVLGATSPLDPGATLVATF